MPTVRGKSEVLAILLADIHLSLKPPIWRSSEPDWLEAQARPLDEVKLLQQKYNCPVICAGDIFDKWNSSPELINFALANLPDSMYAIPGQHDLPSHQLEDIKRSAFWTLVEAGKINILRDTSSLGKNNIIRDDIPIIVYAVPFGGDFEPASKSEKNRLNVVIVHDYAWINGCSYPNAPREKQLGRKTASFRNKKWFGYDVVVYGDNHKGFLTQIGETQIFNCGTLMRRKSDEIDYIPQVGLLLDTGVVIPYFLDISKDEYIAEAKERVEPSLEMGDFFDELEKLGKTALDFKESMEEFFRGGGMSAEANQIILDAMMNKLKGTILSIKKGN
jgi:DNA repair exonuclease SbcCD nuclease subunit